ncbi:MAG TPA: hypothetical protein VNS12_08580 [Pelagibacterium sp.]|uniref:hypothetical protein n=1 Tax=Pelagibacterium sp. TaxID=1967288 RepID=UPI002BB0E91D|nr:hypothetical protein [Pelagibacterium sp.]HWJ88110.1 hypothetical protein [Pelagibacterium sp.]
MTRRAPAPRGACPTLDDPMEVADGLLARFRPERGFSPAQLDALADAAERHGNGLIEVTARGNVQVRGLSEASAGAFRMALEAADIVALRLPAIEFSSIAGDDPEALADPRGLAKRLRQVCAQALQRAPLSPKLALVIEDGGQIGLDGQKADIRLRAALGGWALEVGGSGMGLLDEADVTEMVGRLLGALQAKGPRARATDLDAGELAAIGELSVAGGAERRRVALGRLHMRAGYALRVGVPFGQVGPDMVRALSKVMAAFGVGEARPAPERTLVLVGAQGDGEGLDDALEAAGWWAHPDTAGGRLTLCSGAESSDGGVIHAAQLTGALARIAPDLLDGSVHIHVSTCAKGCAFTGRPGVMLDGNRLVLYDSATQRQLATFDPTAIEADIVSLVERIRDNRKSGETTLDCLSRLGPP